MSTFPPVALNRDALLDVVGEDSTKFSMDFEDKTIRTPTESGYEFTRKRHTRSPRRIYYTGFTNLINAQKVAIEAFIASVSVGAIPFEYEDPTTLEVVNVRFTASPKFTYRGIQGVHLWDIDNVVMKEV